MNILKIVTDKGELAKDTSSFIRIIGNYDTINSDIDQDDSPILFNGQVDG